MHFLQHLDGNLDWLPWFPAFHSHSFKEKRTSSRVVSWVPGGIDAMGRITGLRSGEITDRGKSMSFELTQDTTNL